MKQARGYQLEAEETVFQELELGCQSQIIEMATGLGKTFVGCLIAKRMKEYNPIPRVLWVTHTEELIEQSARALIYEFLGKEAVDYVLDEGDYLNVMSSVPDAFSSDMHKSIHENFGIVKAELMKITAPYVVASIQTLHRRLEQFTPNYFDLIVIDECHYAGAATWKKTIDYFKPSLLLGLTATPQRTDGVSMTDIFDKIVFSRDIVFGIQNKHLCEIDAYTIKTSVSLDTVKTRGGDFATGELENLINTEERNEYIYQKWKLYAEARPTLIFAVDVQHAQDLTKVFRKHGVLCDFVVGDKELTPERKAVMSAFTSGDLHVLVNVNIATTGFDYPNLGCLLMARPTKSRTLYMQMLGRGTRLKNDKVDFTDCIVLDIVDNTSRHKLINAASLEDGKRIEDRVLISQERREALIASRDARKMKEIKEEKRVKLIPLPEIKVYDTYRNREPATAAQLTLLERLGYNGSFTLGQAMEIINGFEANAAQIEFLRKHGYDVSNGVTFGQFSKISAELKRKEFAQKLRLPFTNIK